MSDQLDRITAALSHRYEVERELGRGGMAVVYLAQDLKHERKVALKVLRPELAATVGAERFLREIRIAAQLNHPHILMLIDSGEVSDSLYYVMPYVAGESLRDKLTRERELPISDAVRILRDVVDALATAHSYGVIHRDIKPDNVMLSGRHALVADFGVAKALSQAKSTSDLTTAGVALGTPAYMSPEQAVADEQVDHRSDIYAVGALAYELLTGRPPFLGTTAQMVLSAHVADPPDPVTKYRENVSQPLEHLVMRCLEKKPADRWQSADELLAQLEAVVTPSGGMTPTTTRPVSAARPSPKRRTSKATIALFAAVAAVVLLGGVWLIPKILGSDTAEVDAALPRIVVLPFENLGAPEDEYFADGITDEIRSRMVQLSGLETIARSSAMQYKDTDKTTSQIAAELDVDYMLGGTVRWNKATGEESRVRVIPELVRASDGTPIWSEPFEEELTDVFELQANVAEMVAQALGVSLRSGESETTHRRLTDNMEAYEHYLRGEAVFADAYPTRATLPQAVEQYEMAVQLDPNFAMAYAKLSLAHGGVYWGGHDRSAERMAKCQETAEEALRLDPDLPEGHAALGMYHYRCCLDYTKAHAELELALAAKPDDAFLLYLSAAPYQRAGDLERAAALFSRASDLDPMGWSAAYQSKIAFMLLRDYDNAERYLERSAALLTTRLDLRPEFYGNYQVERAELVLKRNGNVETAREILDLAQERSGLDYWELVSRLNRPNDRILCAQDVDACREGLMLISPDEYEIGNVDYYMTMADLYHWVGNESTSFAYYDSAATAAAAEREAYPESEYTAHQFPGYSARIAAARGDTAEAIRHLNVFLQERLTPTDRSQAIDFEASAPAAESFLLVGEIEAALEQLEYFLSIPSYLSVGLLRVDPLWDPLRDDPRFLALLERYGGNT